MKTITTAEWKKRLDKDEFCSLMRMSLQSIEANALVVLASYCLKFHFYQLRSISIYRF